MEILAISCGFVLSQNAPRISPSNPQNIAVIKALAILKQVTKSIGAVISSGFGGIPKYALIVTVAYRAGIMTFFT